MHQPLRRPAYLWQQIAATRDANDLAWLVLREAIGRYRYQHRLSQQQLADRLGISRNLLANYENGRNGHQNKPQGIRLARALELHHEAEAILATWKPLEALYRELGQSIRAWRVQNDLSQEAYADRAGISRDQVSLYEAGRNWRNAYAGWESFVFACIR